MDYRIYKNYDLEKLTEREREILTMRINGLKCAEIGKQLGIKEQSVHISLNKSLKKLNGEYEQLKEYQRNYQREYQAKYLKNHDEIRNHHREYVRKYSSEYYEKNRKIRVGFNFCSFIVVDMKYIMGNKNRMALFLCECKKCGFETWMDSKKITKFEKCSEKCPKCGADFVDNQKICSVCGKLFTCPEHEKTETCSAECKKIYNEYIVSETMEPNYLYDIEQREKLHNIDKKINEYVEHVKNQKNVMGKHWHLVDPDGKHYEFYSLNNWSKENCELFGFEKSECSARKIRNGISNAKIATIKKSGCNTYKGWQVIIDEENEQNPQN